MTNLEKFNQLVSETFGIKEEEIKDDLSPDDVGNWTSISHMELVSKFDQAFDINLDVDDATDMDDIKNMKVVLKKHGVEL